MTNIIEIASANLRNRIPCISLVGLTRFGKTSVLNALASVESLRLNLIGFRPVKDVLIVKVDCTGLSELAPTSFWRFITYQLIKTTKDTWPGFVFQPHQYSDANAFEICHWHLQQLVEQKRIVAVSYTHLTLPTIYSV